MVSVLIKSFKGDFVHRVKFISVLLAVVLVGCESTDDEFEVLLTTDTLELAAPTANSALPSALDIDLGIGRFPESFDDAQLWDVAVRFVGGQLKLVPGSAIGVTDDGGRSRAQITDALAGRTFESVRQAPNTSAFDTASVVLQQGAVYVIRSRLIPCGISAVQKYAKTRPLEVDLAQQRVKLEVVISERCGDQRLAEED